MKIYSPNKEYNGVTAGVAFAAGVGETDNMRLIKYFKENGYKVESVKKQPAAKPEKTTVSPEEGSKKVKAKPETGNESGNKAASVTTSGATPEEGGGSGDGEKGSSGSGNSGDGSGNGDDDGSRN